MLDASALGLVLIDCDGSVEDEQQNSPRWFVVLGICFRGDLRQFSRSLLNYMQLANAPFAASFSEPLVACLDLKALFCCTVSQRREANEMKYMIIHLLECWSVMMS